MFQRPLYQTAVALLTLAALAGAVYFAASPGAPPGIEITMPPAVNPATPAATTAPAAASDGRVNINTASAAELATLPMIGPSRAENIVAYREANGPFERTDLIMDVPLIGQGIFDLVRDSITVGD